MQGGAPSDLALRVTNIRISRVVYRLSLHAGDRQVVWPFDIELFWNDPPVIGEPPGLRERAFRDSIRLWRRDFPVDRVYRERHANCEVLDGHVIHGAITSIGEELLDEHLYDFGA